MNSFRPEPHVAQQSRRDKLRVQQTPLPATHHQFRDVRLYDPPPAPMFSSAGGVLDFTAAGGEGSFMNPSTSGIHDSAGWIMNCVGGAQIQTPSLFPSHLYHLKNPNLSGYHDVSGDLSSQKQFGDLHFPSTQLYNTALHDVVTSAVGNQTLDAGPPGSWVDTGNELLLLPSYGNSWYGDDGDLARIKPEGGFASATIPTGGSLSLSLSSNPQVAQFEQEQLAGLQNSRATFSPPYPKLSVSSGQGIVGSNPQDPRRGAGPLGPFTGYAAILKSSKFLKPAQQLLDEFCSVATGSRLAKQCDASARSSGTGVGDSGSNGRGGNSGVSSSSFYSSTEAAAGDGGAASSGACQVHRPEFQQKKAKLLYMQEEVCRRYKQYHQQMQMVVSSFESVAGLSAATPYTSLALKAIAKHFRCLKNLITDQLQHVSKLLGEEFMSSPSSSKGDTTPRLKCMGQSTRKQKAAENSLNFLDHSQPVWRPQRGLPERAVAVLRAWLFEHFLHPYPTDTDKHMLATQTGLSRNQVSNWFINARVRLWKPMVEEIHMLETKGMSGMDLNSSNRNEGKPTGNEEGQPSSDQMSEAQSNKPMDCSPLEPMLDEESSRAMEQWHREKRTRMEECGIPTGLGGSLMSFAAYPGGMDIGGLGAVSLTLGLQHNEGSQQQQQQMRRHFGSHMIHDFVG